MGFTTLQQEQPVLKLSLLEQSGTLGLYVLFWYCSLVDGYWLSEVVSNVPRVWVCFEIMGHLCLRADPHQRPPNPFLERITGSVFPRCYPGPRFAFAFALACCYNRTQRQITAITTSWMTQCWMSKVSHFPTKTKCWFICRRKIIMNVCRWVFCFTMESNLYRIDFLLYGYWNVYSGRRDLH